MDYFATDLTGMDLSQTDLTGENLAHCTLTGCTFGRCVGTNFVCTQGENINFTGADITNTTFEKASESVLQCLTNAVWNGVTVVSISPWLVTNGYWCFATNAFVQCGCMQKTFTEWDRICATSDSIQELNQNVTEPVLLVDLAFALQWWQHYRATILSWLSINGAK